ncbi:hypothetical protein B9Z55_008601 [Caenorhabditis nigoni]|uniref:Domain of unknown function WSN domain-containing protein n=1 Tax=Caenorhabditis nigoni TaxID=1611254 RepID=A0A2G5UNN8_9PELO|nr:hypothetical protein B9Z55_008601 [Caenorhabditis nigoni]
MKIQILVVVAFLVLHFNGAFPTKTPSELEDLTNNYISMEFTKQVKSTDAFDKLPGVFRILSAINLQNQLSNKSINMDTVVQEILNLKSLKDLESFDKEKVDNFADKISKANFSSELYTEDAFIDVRKIQESWNSVYSKIQKFPKTLKGLEVVKTWNISGIFKEVDIDQILKELEGGGKTDFQKLLDARDKIPEFSGVWKLLNSVRSISKLAGFMKVLKSTPLNVLKSFKNRKQGFQANLKILNDLATEDLDFIKLVGQSRPIDLENLSENLQDPWILKNIQSYAPLDGLNRLIRLNKPIKEFQGSLNIPNYLETTLKIMTLKSKPVEVEKIQKLADNLYQNCFTLTHAHDPGETDKVKQLADNVNWLIIKVQALRAVTEAEVVGGKGLETKTDLKEELISLKPHISILKDPANSVDVIKEIIGSGNYITQFSNNSILQDYVKLFDCIQKVQGAEFLEVSIRNIQFLREQNSEFSKSLKDISSDVSRSVESLEAVKDVGEGIRNEGNLNLTIFKDLEIYSSKIRNIQMFLNTIQVLENPKNPFKKFQKAISELQEALYPMTSDLEAMEFLEVIEGRFQKTSEEIQHFLKRLKKWKKEFKIAGNFKNLGLELTKLKEIGDLEIPGTSEIDSFESTKSGKSVTKELSNLKKAIWRMEGLELRFSSYNVSVEDVEKIFGILRNGSKNSGGKKAEIDHTGPTAFMITMICVGIVVLCAFLYFCLFDYRFPLYTIRQNLWNKMYKNKQKNMKTAREGKPPISGFPAQKDVKRGADGREIREKNQPGSAESLPPPPPIPEPSEAKKSSEKVPEASGTSGNSKPKSSENAIKPAAKPVSKEQDPLNSPRALKPPKKELKVQKTDETSPTPSAAPAIVKKQPSKTKTTVEPSKTTKTSTKDESAADEKSPPPQAPPTKAAPPTKQPSKKKDTLADDVDSTEKVERTKSESKITYTRESKNTLDDADPKIFDEKVDQTNLGSSEPPPLPHRREKSKKK